MFGGGLIVPGPRRRPHRLPADARRQPVRVERQPGDGARLARADRGAAGPWRQARRRRPAAQPHRRRRPTSGSPSPGHRRRSCSPRWSDVLLDDGLVDLGDVAPLRRRASTARRRRSSPFGPDEVAERHRHRRGDDPPARPRAGRRTDGRRLRTHRHDHRRVRHGRQLARRRAQRLHRQPRPTRRGDVHHARVAGVEHPRRARGRARRAARPIHSRGSRPARARSASCRPCASPRRSRPPGEGQIRALVVRRRQPGAVATRTASASTPPSTRSTSWCRSTSTVNETSRHADVILPAPSALEKRALRRRPAAARRAQRRQLVASRCSARRG